MGSLEKELDGALRLDVEPIIEQIRAEGGGLEGLAKIVEQVVIPLVGGQRAAIMRLARELDELRAALYEIRRDE